jgi:hypothetical protein
MAVSKKILFLDGITGCPEKHERPILTLIQACPLWTVSLFEE